MEFCAHLLSVLGFLSGLNSQRSCSVLEQWLGIHMSNCPIVPRKHFFWCPPSLALRVFLPSLPWRLLPHSTSSIVCTLTRWGLSVNCSLLQRSFSSEGWKVGLCDYLVVSLWPLQQCHVGVLSHEVSLRSHQKVVGYSHNICASIAPVSVSCQASLCSYASLLEYEQLLVIKDEACR